MKVRTGFGAGALAVVAALGMLSTASATTFHYDFSNNIGGNPGGETGASFKLAVTDVSSNGTNRARFTFTNTSSNDGAAITGIYFYDGVIFSGSPNVTVTGNTGKTPGTTWGANGGTPENLPGITDYFGQGGGASFPATLEFYSATGPGGINNGIFNTDDLSIEINLNVSFGTMISMLEAGFGIGSGFNSADHFVIGIQVQGLPDSAQYVVSVIPLPAPVWMGLAGLVGVIALRRRLSK